MLECPGGADSFIEASTQALGGQLYTDTATKVCEETIEWLKELSTDMGFEVSYCQERELLNAKNCDLLDGAVHLITARLIDVAKRTNVPVRHINIDDIYRRAAQELQNLM